MSGTNPDNVKPPLGGSSSSRSENAPRAKPKKASNRKHALAVSLNGDDKHFGIDSTFLGELDSLANELKVLTSEHSRVLKLGTKATASEIKDIHEKLGGCLKIFSDKGAVGAEVYFEGKVISSETAKKLEDFEELFSSSKSEYGSVTMDDISQFFQDEENARSDAKEDPGFAAEAQIKKLTETLTLTDVRKKTYAEASDEKKISQKEKKISWADLVEEDLAQEALEKISKLRGSLVSVIRSRAGVSQENRIEIPKNLEKTLPNFYEKVVLACRLADCEMVENGKVNIRLAYPDAFGTDEVVRNNVLSSLYDNEGKPKKELLALADFAVLQETLLEIPSVDSLEMGGAGRIGTLHAASLILRVYAEQVYNVPIAAQRNWWKGSVVLRNEMKEKLLLQVGNIEAAQCILNFYDVLYRKFIRRIISNGNTEIRQKLDKLADDLSKKLFVTGGGLFSNLLRTETRSKKVKVEVPSKGKKGTVEKIEEVKYLARVRPHITDGPKTPFESAIYAKVNGALSKVEKHAKNYSFASKLFTSPTKWEEHHRLWVEDLYSRTKIASHLMVQRKQAIRARIIAQKAPVTEQQNGKAVSDKPEVARILSSTWMNVQSTFMEENESKFDDASVKAVNDMLGTTFTKDGLIKLAEDEILTRLASKSIIL